MEQDEKPKRMAKTVDFKNPKVFKGMMLLAAMANQTVSAYIRTCMTNDYKVNKGKIDKMQKLSKQPGE